MSPTLLSALPTVNAVLNGTSAVLLFTGYLFIRRRKVTAHKICMLSASQSRSKPAVFLPGREPSRVPIEEGIAPALVES